MAKRGISDPYEPVAHMTERTAAARLAECMNQIIERTNLPLGRAEVEMGGSDSKFPDIVLFKSPQSRSVLVVIEAKLPAFNPLSDEELKEPARRKASHRKAPYFCTTNFKDLYCFITEQVNKLAGEAQQIFGHYRLSTLEDLSRFDEPAPLAGINRAIERFLTDLCGAMDGKAPEPRHPVDELLVLRLQETIHALARQYRQIIALKAGADRSFRKALVKWFVEQGWTFEGKDDDFQVAARQTAYLLVNKIVFYSAIQPVRRLDPLVIPEGMKCGAVLEATLQGYFNEVLKIDYQTIYTTDFIDQLAFPDSSEVVDEVKGLITAIARFDFSTLGYDVIGRICERLIPEEERHILGQYFTDPDVVDLILRFCMQREADKVLDPACGAGTFLVRAYQHKKLMNQRLEHEAILSTLWGNDIAKFAAHLSTINLAINDLRSNENFPNVVQNDFFDLNAESDVFPTRGVGRRVKVKALGGGDLVVQHPRYFDCIVGNPPYTRHLEIGEIQGTHKEKVIKKALSDPSGKPLAKISRRAGIYAYFFVHGSKFLQNGGRFGFIVSNSWLDADYGAGLQEHFLNEYKILAIIESKVERWFPDAEINTCIVILEKASGERNRKAREENPVRFVYLQKPLRHFIPPAESLWSKQVARLDAIDGLVKTVLGHSSFYENDEMRIYPKKQAGLWEEGWDQKERTYVGAKWGKYVRAPKIFFTVIEKGMGKLKPLQRIAEVNEGRPTGANEFFFVRKDVAAKFRIEDEFLRPGLMRPRGHYGLRLEASALDRFFFAVVGEADSLRGTGAHRYILRGERDRLHTRATFAKKREWYRIAVRPPADLIVPCGTGERFWCMRNAAGAVSSNSFTEIRLDCKDHIPFVWAFLNSAVGWLFLELHGRTTMGGGMLKVDPTDVRKMPVLDPAAFKGDVLSAMQPLLARPVSKVQQEATRADRGLLDDLIMRDALGLSEAEQQEVYDAVVDLVGDRLKRAGSVAIRRTGGPDVDIQTLVDSINQQVGTENIGTFYTSVVMPLPGVERPLPHFKSLPKMEKTLYCWRVYAGQTEIDCGSRQEARFLSVLAEAGFRTVHVPSEAQALDAVTTRLDALYRQTKAALEDVASSIAQNRVRARLIRLYWSTVRENATGTSETEA